MLENFEIEDYELITIISRDESASNDEVIAETVSSIYCPLCQKNIEGKGIITTIGSQIMGFCCETCKIEFIDSYNQISQT